MKTERQISQGFDRGNFDAAYSGDFDERVSPETPHGAGYILGFFSSYERHEIPAAHRAYYDHAIDSPYGRIAKELGYVD